MDLQAPIRDVISQLNQPISSLDSLLSLLTAPLAALHLLPAQYACYNINPVEHIDQKHVTQIQKALIEHILPTWDQEEHVLELVDLYFLSPPTASHAYATLLSIPFTSYSIRFLARLADQYPLDRLSQHRTKEWEWEECIRNLLAVPTKVANWCFAQKVDIPSQLEFGPYFGQVCLSCERLIANDRDVSPIIAKLSKLGIFPSAKPSFASRSTASFWAMVLPVVRKQLGDELYRRKWRRVFTDLSASALALRGVLTSLLASLDLEEGSSKVKREARLLYKLVPLDSDEMVECAVGIILNPGKDWGEIHAKVWVYWFVGSGDLLAIQKLFEDTLSLWCSPEHIKYSLLSRHRYITLLLLLTTVHLPSSSLDSSRFISAVSMYISQMDNSVRKCGMLVAEVIAERAGKKLDFGDWDGDEWAKEARRLIREKDINLDAEEVEAEEIELNATEEMPMIAEVSTKHSVTVDSDDESLAGYDSPPSSRSASPAPSELDEIAQDPSLGVGKKKVARPVYLAQLGALLRGPIGLTDGGTNASEEADKIDVALDVAEDLVRKKRAFGTELEENAVNLTHGLIGLQDNFNLRDFEGRKQRGLNALVACCPTKVAPCLIEEFFKNQYSSAQRYSMLNALALGARELAGFSEATPQPDFPSKRLPPALDRKYIAGIVQDVTRQAIEKGKQGAIDKVPELVRERRLKVKTAPKVVPLEPGMAQKPQQQNTTFHQIAAEYFILPLINRFWLFLKDEMAREERTQYYEGRAKYSGTGTGLVLNPLVLAHLLRTVAVMVHLSRNAMEWLGVIATAALELAVVLGTRKIGYMEGDDDDDDERGDTGASEGDKKEAAVLTAALELSLVVLDGCIDLDRGKSLSLENPALLMGTSEWANAVLARVEGDGMRVAGTGGMEEVNLRRAAAGVVLKVEEIREQWKSSMIDYL
ncbi:telomere binding protein [Paramarasmius palmivorus]|uniref:Telomere binding protein n=1 Tax=Paramarasmius palmivorus TaxID=297713 RepID=A0AAW0CUV0_9AGAR